MIGNRPQFVKAAAVSTKLRERADEVLVHTGQHYDRELSEVFFEELRLPPPDHQLNVGSGSHAEQTAAIVTGLEPLLAELEPDAVLVYGDTNSTLGGALVAAKAQVPLAHVEAGMRSFNRSMPEEVNRVVADALSALSLCSTEAAVENLAQRGARRHGGPGRRRDGRRRADLRPDRRRALGRARAPRPGAARLHRRHRPPRRQRRRPRQPPRRWSTCWPARPRSRPSSSRSTRGPEPGSRPRACWTASPSAGITAVDPLGYLDITRLVRASRAVLTDSGGLQKEAFLASVPCVTMREETEWVETVETGWNRLVGLDPDAAAAALEELPAPGRRTHLAGGRALRRRPGGRAGRRRRSSSASS